LDRVGHFTSDFEPGDGTNTNVAALGGMTRPTNIFNKSRRRKEDRAANSRAYKRQAASEYKKALDKFLYGSLGGASPVRRIDPKTGDVVAVIDPPVIKLTNVLDYRPSGQEWPQC
jgi:hypothetical protein